MQPPAGNPELAVNKQRVLQGVHVCRSGGVTRLLLAAIQQIFTRGCRRCCRICSEVHCVDYTEVMKFGAVIALKLCCGSQFASWTPELLQCELLIPNSGH